MYKNHEMRKEERLFKIQTLLEGMDDLHLSFLADEAKRPRDASRPGYSQIRQFIDDCTRGEKKHINVHDVARKILDEVDRRSAS